MTPAQLRPMLARMARFAGVGILATLVHAAVYTALTSVGAEAFLANLLAFAAALPVSYLGQRRFVFGAAGAPLRFVLLQLGGLGLNTAWVAAARLLAIDPRWALAGMVAVTPALAFWAAGRWVFPAGRAG